MIIKCNNLFTKLMYVAFIKANRSSKGLQMGQTGQLYENFSKLKKNYLEYCPIVN